MKNKAFFSMSALLCLFLAGCDDGGNTTVTEGVSLSEKEEYLRMVAESDAQMQAGVDAEKELLKANPKGIEE